MTQVVGEVVTKVTTDLSGHSKGLAQAKQQAVGFDNEMQKALKALNASTIGLTQSNNQLAASLQKTTAAKRTVTNQTKEMDKALKGAERAGAAMGRTLTRNFTGLAASVIGIRAAMQSIEDTTAVGRLSQQTGIAIDQLSGLKFAAEQVGIPFATLSQTITQFAQRMAEGLANPGSRVTLALRELGVSARDSQGNLRTFVDFLPDAADAFSRLQDGLQKTQLAAALFGEEAGPRLIPLLNAGRAGIDQLILRARELGLVLDESGIRRAQELQRASYELQSALAAVSRELILIAAQSGVIDLLKALAAALANVRPPTIGSASELEDVGRRLQTVQVEVNDLIAKLREAQTSAGPGGWLTQLLFGTGAGAAHLEELLKQETELLLRFQSLNSQGSGGMGKGATPPADLARLTRERADTLARARADLDVFMSQVSGQGTLLESMNFAWTNHADVVTQAIAKIRAANENAVQAEIQIAAVRRQLAVQYEQAQIQVARTAASTITALWPKQKGAAIAAATINIGVGVTEAMKLPFPLNWAQAALIVAAGGAQISAIRSTNLGGGGSVPSVGGGGGSGAGFGGGDALTPDDTPPARAVTINLEPFKLYTGEQIADLIEAINTEVQNGAVLISTKNSGS